jgi:hypothetical protein
MTLCGYCWYTSAIEAAWLPFMRPVRTFSTHRFNYFYCLIILLLWKNSFVLDRKFKTTYRPPINHGHIYNSDYQTKTTQSEQKGLRLFPGVKQAWNPEGMNVNTETHLPETFCPSLLN